MVLTRSHRQAFRCAWAGTFVFGNLTLFPFLFQLLPYFSNQASWLLLPADCASCCAHEDAPLQVRNSTLLAGDLQNKKHALSGSEVPAFSQQGRALSPQDCVPQAPKLLRATYSSSRFQLLMTWSNTVRVLTWIYLSSFGCTSWHI